MIVPGTCRIAATLLALALASGSAHAEIHKCSQGERIVYQSSPCPPGSQSLTLPEALPPPSAYTVEEARSRAKNDIAEAEALRKRDEKSAATREKARAAASKQETDCTRLLDKINQAEAKAEPSKQQKKTLKSDQRKYRKECGAL
ncbi:MAG: hypothetical protein Q8Q28_08965 [Pseudomonadota bacterium]|nr:hypothetical protein [Pseudomonadota bacterium]